MESLWHWHAQWPGGPLGMVGQVGVREATQVDDNTATLARSVLPLSQLDI